MLIKAKRHSQLLYSHLLLFPSLHTSITSLSSLYPLLKPTFLFTFSLFPPPAPSFLSFLSTFSTHFNVSFHPSLHCLHPFYVFLLSPIFPPSPASFVPPPHYFTSPPVDPCLSSFPFLVPPSFF